MNNNDCYDIPLFTRLNIDIPTNIKSSYWYTCIDCW